MHVLTGCYSGMGREKTLMAQLATGCAIFDVETPKGYSACDCGDTCQALLATTRQAVLHSPSS
eukprot:6483691-Amphidinium_carterae.2